MVALATRVSLLLNFILCIRNHALQQEVTTAYIIYLVFSLWAGIYLVEKKLKLPLDLLLSWLIFLSLVNILTNCKLIFGLNSLVIYIVAVQISFLIFLLSGTIIPHQNLLIF